MNQLTISRRNFLAAASATAAAQTAENASRGKVRVGVVGLGGRGRTLLSTLLATDLASIRAVCDISAPAAAQALQIIAKSGSPKPEVYSANEQSYKQLMHRDDLDAVVIATPWGWHTPMAVEAMRAGKYAAVEVDRKSTRLNSSHLGISYA